MKKLRKKYNKKSLGVLKKKAQFSLKSGQGCVYARIIEQRWCLKMVYKVALSYGRRLFPDTPRKMAESALCAAMIYRCHGPQVFRVVFEDLRQNNGI